MVEMWKAFNWIILTNLLLAIQYGASLANNDNNGPVQRNRNIKRKVIGPIPLNEYEDYDTAPYDFTRAEIEDRQNSNDEDDGYDDEILTDQNESEAHVGVSSERKAPKVSPGLRSRDDLLPPDFRQHFDSLLSSPGFKSSDATTSVLRTATVELCPSECKCLGDLVDCVRGDFNTVPNIPQWARRLELSHNDFDSDHCEQRIRNLNALTSLFLNQNKLSRMPVFVGLDFLDTLELANNQIQEISTKALLAVPRLTTLDLSHNLIHSISPNAFPKRNSIHKLNLNYNQLEVLDRRIFSPLKQMTELKMNHNQISSLPLGLFTNQKKLKKLSLNGNQLRDMQWATFSNLTALTSLKLRNNFVKELITGVFHGLNSLNILDLANNELTEVQRDGLLNITLLAKLNLSNNSIHAIGKNCWEFTQKITHLNLSLNQLTNITMGTFEMLTKLRILDLHGNRISTITSGAFNTTTNLESLDLSQNRISWIIEDSVGPFASLQKLNSFSLQDNQIKTINKYAFYGLESLTYLDLRKNNITTLYEGAFDSTTTPLLRHLLINSTSLICDCNMSWFYYWMKKNVPAAKFTVDQGGEQVDMRCAYPAALKKKPLLQLSKENFTCHDTPQPRIIDEPQASILAIKASNLTLECTAVVTVGSTIIFKWKHDNNDINPTLVETKFKKKDANRSRFKEKLIERRREANRSPQRIHVSPPKVPLTSSLVSKLKFTDDDDDDNEEDDDDYENDNDDSNSFNNSADEQELDTDDNRGVEEDIEENLPINSTIAISRVHLNNVQDSHAGRYQCIASNNFGASYSQRSKVTVASFPVFTKQPHNVVERSSNTVRLDCAADGDPKPQIYWQFNFGNDFPAARERRMLVMPGDEAFFITKAKLSDQGVYTCTAENPAGVIKANATVEILEAPSFVKPMENKDVIIGESSLVECMKAGSPTPQIRWYKDGKLLEPTNRHFFTVEDQLLIIVKTAEQDAGIYTCEMENTLGNVSASMKLTVRSVLSAANEINNSYGNAINVDKMTAIVIITVVCCAVCTSIIWVVIIYQTKKKGNCSAGNGSGNNSPVQRNQLDKEDPLMLAANVSMLPKEDNGNNAVKIQPMRTATISNARGVARSSSGSSCGVSSTGISDEIFRHYKDYCSGSNTPLHQSNRNGTESDEDEQNDHKALLGTTYFETDSAKYPKIAVSQNSQDKDSFTVQMHDAIDSSNSPIDTGTGNTTTAECVDDDQASPLKTKPSVSLSSSNRSISPLPYNYEIDAHNESTSPTKPVIQPVPIGRVKPLIQTNKLNDLMATYKK